jgi:hypothetical protein
MKTQSVEYRMYMWFLVALERGSVVQTGLLKNLIVVSCLSSSHSPEVVGFGCDG